MESHKIIPIIADGNCLFRCFSWCREGLQERHSFYREQIVQHVLSYWPSYENHIVGDTVSFAQGGNQIITSYLRYQQLMSQNGYFGGESEIIAFSQKYLCRVEVHMYEINNDVKVFGKENLFPSYKLILTGSYDFAHYQIIEEYSNQKYKEISTKYNFILNEKRNRFQNNKIKKTDKNNARRCQRYRMRKKKEKTNLLEYHGVNQSPSKLDEQSNSKNFKRHKNEYSTADQHFDVLFKQNSFGHVCMVCDRIWFKND